MITFMNKAFKIIFVDGFRLRMSRSLFDISDDSIILFFIINQSKITIQMNLDQSDYQDYFKGTSKQI